MLIDAQYEFG